MRHISAATISGRAALAEGEPAEIGFQPSYSRAAAAIRRDIVQGRIADGERLTTTELAHHYGLSLAPIREALHQLAAEGVVVFEPKRGAITRGVTAEFLREIYEIRLGLVPYLEGERAALATDADVERMVAEEALYERAAASGDITAAIRRNAEFHGAALAVRRNDEAVQILRRHHNLILEVRSVCGFTPSRLDRVVEEHRELIEAFRARSAERAQRISREHIRGALDELLEVRFPDRG
jgi:DNA-binding GntR family transcriptional regulator